MLDDHSLSPQQDEWLEEHYLRHSWTGEYRPWRYGEPCPAQMRDRLAPEWRRYDEHGNPHFEEAAGLPTGGEGDASRVERAHLPMRSPRRTVRSEEVPDEG